MGILKDKNILIVGVANKHSIAAGIAESMAENGANIALTYQNERLKSNVEKLGKDWGVSTYLPCDVSSDDEIKSMFSGEEANHRIMQLYQDKNVSPFYSVKSLFGFLIQIPIFIAVFDVLGESIYLLEKSFLLEGTQKDSAFVLSGVL